MFTIEQIYRMLSSQPFLEWHERDFEAHVGWGGPPEAKSKEEILVDLKRMLG